MEKRNKEVRKEIARAGLTLWQVGERWGKGVSEGTMVRKFRQELSETDKAEIRAVIKELKAENENG